MDEAKMKGSSKYLPMVIEKKEVEYVIVSDPYADIQHFEDQFRDLIHNVLVMIEVERAIFKLLYVVVSKNLPRKKKKKFKNQIECFDNILDQCSNHFKQVL